jgi:hypothetical protein
MVGGGVLAFV